MITTRNTLILYNFPQPIFSWKQSLPWRMIKTMENSPATTHNSPAKFRSFSERASLFHNNSPATLHYSPATTILNENPESVMQSIKCIIVSCSLH